MFVCTQLPEDLNAFWAYITFYGGECQLNLNNRVTHLVVKDPKGVSDRVALVHFFSDILMLGACRFYIQHNIIAKLNVWSVLSWWQQIVLALTYNQKALCFSLRLCFTKSRPSVWIRDVSLLIKCQSDVHAEINTVHKTVTLLFRSVIMAENFGVIWWCLLTNLGLKFLTLYIAVKITALLIKFLKVEKCHC